ncbi:MAG: flavin-containing monooxygenase [Hyphomonadaceae bacterium]
MKAEVIKRVKVAVIGAGVSGICAGVHLKRFTDWDFLILEKAEDLGGTWRENTYPGVECDVPSHLYSFSFELKPDWSREFPSGAEILSYLHDVANKYGLGPHLMFGAQVDKAEFDEGSWLLSLASGEQIRAEAIISALGILHVPKYPDWPGLEDFSGPAFHTARWRHDVDLAGKNVAIVGTGATTVQCGPKVAEIADRLYVFQRTPVWVAAKKNPPISAEEQELLRRDFSALRKKRWDLWKTWESTGLEMVTPGSALNRKAEALAVKHLRAQVRDPDLAAALTPNYNFTCKRPTSSNEYYAMFNQPNVELVQEAIARIEPEAIVTESGRRAPIDVLIMATGFKSFDITNELDIRGEGGVSLREVWGDRIVSYQTVMAPQMPNLFLLFGPNSGGLTSAYEFIEAACGYIIKAIKYMHENGHAAMTPKLNEVLDFSEEIQRKYSKTTQNKGCVSWWTDGKGYTHAMWPSSSVEYRLMMGQFIPEHFDFRKA